jgi:Tfp pilus assembly protein PilF
VQNLRQDARQAIVRAGRLSAAGKFGEAAAVFESLLESDPENMVAHVNLIGLYSQVGDNDKAEAAYRAGLAVAPDNAKLHNNYGILLLKAQRNDEAVAAFDKALASDDQLANAFKYRGMAHQRLGDAEAARRDFAASFELDPLDFQAGYLLGTAQLLAREFEDAATTLSQTVEPVSPLTPTYLRALAQAYFSAGNMDNAADALTRARAIASDYGQSEAVAEIDRELTQIAEADAAATP